MLRAPSPSFIHIFPCQIPLRQYGTSRSFQSRLPFQNFPDASRDWLRGHRMTCASSTHLSSANRTITTGSRRQNSEDPSGRISEPETTVKLSSDDEHHVIVERPKYSAGKPWQDLPLKPLFEGSFMDGKKRTTVDASFIDLPPHRLRPDHVKTYGGQSEIFEFGVQYDPSIPEKTLFYRLLHVIANTQSPEDAWTAYSSLLELPRPVDIPPDAPQISFAHLHRLSRLLSREKPKTRKIFLRLLSVMYTIQKMGGELKLFAWNALMDNAGKGWRKSTPADFKFALNVFSDMVKARAPGNSFSPDHYQETRFPSQSILPDIFTYTTLINIASKTLHAPALSHSYSLLQSSGVTPNRVTPSCPVEIFRRHWTNRRSSVNFVPHVSRGP
ncbi:hypothetical protein C8J56DRAFT_561932 [Mycena floridula]|nr:hypothetical protein C8J56DRAFT_561932 [Mycena floridula]